MKPRQEQMLVLTWNLSHGRSVPGAGRDLRETFATRIAGWDWDVALLQEVPPWWPRSLARAAGAEERSALTSRNAVLPLRRLLAERGPDLIKSNGGGANAVLSRQPIVEHRALRLRTRPERRVAQLVRLADGTCAANFHGSTRVPLAEAELRRLWGEALAFAREAPLVLGGDLNLRSPQAPARDILHIASRDVDHLFSVGFVPEGAETLERSIELDGRELWLSDHPPLVARLGTTSRD
jgi:endonuclease/exonuclease/phosphatase family metal-dependent hydrolase